MKKILLCLFILSSFHTIFSQNLISYLTKKSNTTQLIVDGKPFIILGGELGNSTATFMQNMKPAWANMN